MNVAEHCDCDAGCAPGCCPVAIARQGPRLSFVSAIEGFNSVGKLELFHGPRFNSSYFDWGTGPRTIIFGHGLSDRSSSFLPLASLLKDRFRCIGWDLPGSTAPANEPLPWIRHRHLAEHLLALIKHLAIERPVVLGASFGSTVALRALAMAPGRFAGGILQGGFAHRPLDTTQRNLVRLVRFFRQATMNQLPRYRDFLARANGKEFEGHDPERWEHLVACAGPTPVRTVCHQALLLDKTDLRPMLPLIKLPMLLVCGTNDRVVNQECSEALLEGLPMARRVTLGECGHVPCYTDVEALAALIVEFMDHLQEF
jgi:pimeloyl-ACP methyl ester carboxylesterase